MKRLTDTRRSRCVFCEAADEECAFAAGEFSAPCPDYSRYQRLADIEDILGDDYDLDRLKELVEKDRNSAFAPYSKFPEKGQEVWYWDSENGISRGIVSFVDDALNEFGVDFPDENDFDIFAGSAWGTCIVASKEATLEKMKEDK